MPITYPVSHKPYLGKGSMFVDVFDAAGALTGYQHLGNCTTVEQEIKDDKAELFQHINATPTLIATAVKKRVESLKITGTDFSSDHLAIALMSAGKTELATGAVAVIGEALASATATKKGKYFATLGRNLDPSAIAVRQAGTLSAGTDYVVVDAVEGMIYFPVTSGVDDSAAVLVDYTPISTSFDQVAPAVAPFVKGRLRFSSDPTDGPKIGAEWWLVNLSPSGKVELIKDDYGNWELEGMVLADTAGHPTAPYGIVTFY